MVGIKTTGEQISFLSQDVEIWHICSYMTRIVRSCSLSTFLFVIDRRTRDHGHKRGRRSRYRMVVGFIKKVVINNRNYSAILATLQITSYAIGV
jgi:hypothetical protein